MLSNLLVTSPDALAAQKEKKEGDQAARKEELNRLRNLLDYYTNESKVRNLLPEDVEYFKKFLKARIEKIQTSPSLTEDQILALKDDKESYNFDTLRASAPRRAQFKDDLTNAIKESNATIEKAKKEKKIAPTALEQGIKVLQSGLDWFKKTKFETKDVYDDKYGELEVEYLQKTGFQIGQNSAAVNKANEVAKKAREEFSIGALFRDVAKYVGGYFGITLIIIGMILGSSLATNLNLYRNWTFRLLYAIYGAVFFFLVVPYCLIYRWGIMGHKPKFYSILPLFPYHWSNRLMQVLFGWISFRPDDDILALREWESEMHAAPN